VLAPGGRFVFREHDCSPPEFGVVVDVQHALYARVWPVEAECDLFCDGYYAHYRPRKEWVQLVTGAGFIQTAQSPDRDEKYRAPPAGFSNTPRGYQGPQRLRFKNVIKSYYGLYEKPSLMAAAAPQTSAMDVDPSLNAPPNSSVSPNAV